MISINKQIVYTSIILLFVIILFSITNVDYYIQNLFYDFEKADWILDKNLQPYRFIFYDGIKKILILIAIIFLITLVFFKDNIVIKKYKKGLLIVVLSAIFIPLIIGGIKKYTNMPCPKNEQYYGGKMIKTAVWESYSPKYSKMPNIKCWPAGHASGGFALLSLFFLFKTKRNKIISLYFASIIGWSMGIYKMLIGDHFLSHTIITMLLAWLIILIIVNLIYNFKR